ncbi:MAG TPA: efflux RND transporter permease subunit, partial [Bryobacterales bacterium]|nr:efflux RND transporter permease subunit [Bryobacterales bacterium]
VFSKKAVEPVARFAVNWRYFTFGFAAMLFLLAVAAMAGGKVKFEAFPDLDGNTVAARILLPAGSPLALTERTVAGVIAGLREINREEKPRQPDERDLVRNITVEYNRNDTAGETGPHVATITADLLDAEIRTIRIEEVLAKWREKTKDLPDVVWIRFSETKIGPAGLDIEIRLQGDDLKQMKAASDELMAWLRGYDGAVDISDDLRPGKPEFRIRLKPGARMLGLDGRLVADQLRAAFHFMTVNTVQRDGDSIDIDVQLAGGDRDSVADLDDFDIALPDGRLIPLKAVAEVRPGRGYSRITRINGQRAITITGDVDTRIANANEIVTSAMTDFVPKLLEKYPRLRISLEGADRKARKTQKSILSGFVIGIIGIYLLLSFQFRSYIEPVVVMSIIPFAFVGAIVGHLVMGLNFSMPSLLGLVALSGVVVNNSILLVNFIKHYHGDTASVREAAPLASRARFRAILLTSMTTFVGLLPILTERSLQAQILTPLVSSLAFGLVSATFLVLLVVPSIYAILDDFGLARLDEPGDEDEKTTPVAVRPQRT